jgi:sugar phosphate permease
MEDTRIFYGYLVNSKVIWYILWPFGTVVGHLVYFPRFGIMLKKIWQPWLVSTAKFKNSHLDRTKIFSRSK